MNCEQLEKYSSAITLSDMEIFVFPELMYSLLLADIMSPIIWKWRDLDCFKKIEGKSSYKKLMRLKQFIMDEYEFNLDLETWGLTSRQKELDRFDKFISAEDITRSNALFGYQGDKYYFDVDIRKHFGLDKYNSDIIPYWKTETVEAMDAFKHKSGYSKSAGECVSLSALYAAAAFIVCRIPLEDIYMILTPLHSQNFIDIQDGVLTNNRRIVTKTMWFNGTAIANKAQRALRNENATILAHCSGYVHCLYNDATIEENAYQHFAEQLDRFLSTQLDRQIFANFLRSHNEYQKFFQLCRDCHGNERFLKAEILFHYEHGSNFRIGDSTHDKLIAQIHDEDFIRYKMPDRICCNDFDDFIQKQKIDLTTSQGKAVLLEFVRAIIDDAAGFVKTLADFIHCQAKLPSPDKNYLPTEPVKINTEQSREEIIDYLQSIRKTSTTADLAFYAYRDMQSCNWQPFTKAALERNPISLEMAKEKSVQDIYQWLKGIKDDSIYNDKRLAQPDEVANYKTGDGLEKAFLLANLIHQRTPQQQLQIIAENNKVILIADKKYEFTSNKDFNRKIALSDAD